MSTVTQLNAYALHCVASKYPDNKGSLNTYDYVYFNTWPTVQALPGTWYLYSRYSSAGSALNYKKVLSGTLHVKMRCYSSTSESALIASCKASCSSATYSNMPAVGFEYSLGYIDENDGSKILEYQLNASMASEAIKYGLRWRSSRSTSQMLCLIGELLENNHYINLELDEENNSLEFYAGYPNGTNHNKAYQITFNWLSKETGYSYSPIRASSIELHWRLKNAGAYNVIPVSSSYDPGKVTVAANTFPGGIIEWRLSALTNAGDTAVSEWYSFNTLEAAPDPATPVSPSGNVYKQGDPVPFRWEHNISTGTAPTRSEIQISSDRISWANVWDEIGTATQAEITIDGPTGDRYWRVRTYNTDGITTDWADAVIARFYIFGKPDTPGVTAGQTPRPLIEWQAVGQQGYQVTVVDSAGETVYDTGVQFGTVKEYKLNKYLNDGTYVVNVRVQNKYGYWSENGTAPIVVENREPEENITVSIDNTRIVTLTWTAYPTFSKYIVYRNGIAVYATESNYYFDYYAAGKLEYKVLGIVGDTDNYKMSESVSADIDVDCLTVICEGEDTVMELKYSENEHNRVAVYESVVSQTRHFSGAVYPNTEISAYKNKRISFSVSMMSKEDQESFEKLFGKLVCVKYIGGISVIGILQAMSMERNTFYTTYSVTIEQINTGKEVLL